MPQNLWRTVPCYQCGADAGEPCRGEASEAITGPHGQRYRHGRDEADFWAWIDEQLTWPANVGMTEQQILDRVSVPGYLGRKARTAAPPKVVQMPIRDYRMAAAGDGDEAA